MFASVRTYRFKQNFAKEIDQKVREILMPQLEKIPGFISYAWIESGNGEGTSVSIFENENGAEESLHLAADFRKKHLGHIGLSAPDVMAGTVEAFTEKTVRSGVKEKSQGTHLSH